MALRSVIDISVNASEFERFQAMFAKYQASLQSTPNIWQRVGVQAKNVATASAKAAQASQAQATAGASLVVIQAAGTRHAAAQAGFWSKMATDSGKFALHIADATRSLLRWASLTGLISGILGAGGLFGIERLAASAGTQRAQGFGLGMKPGEAKAYETNLGSRGFDALSFLGNINRGLLDITSPQYIGLHSAGIDTAGKNTNTVALETLTKLKEQLDQYDVEGPNRGLFMSMAHANKFDELMSMDDLIKLRRTPAGEVGEYANSIRKDQKDLVLSDDTTKKWQNLSVQLDNAGAKIKNILIDKLSQLAPQIDELSKAAVGLVKDLLTEPKIKEWIHDLAEGIKRFGEYIKTDEFHENIHKFVEGIGKVATKIENFVGGVQGLIDGVKDVVKFLKILWGTMDEVGRGLASVAHSIIDPLIKDKPVTLNHDEAERWNSDHPDKQVPVPDQEPTNWQKLMRWWNGSDTFSGIEKQSGLPPGLLNSIERQESGGRDVASAKGAEGYFQFMPETARQYGVNVHDEQSSAQGAARYLNDLADKFHGDLEKAVAAYNWGPQNVERDVAQYGERWREHLPEETSKYLSKVAGGAGVSGQPNRAMASVNININNNTGGSAIVSSSQLAV